jgi:two-component system chemotaxis response regulator CheY
MDVFIVEDERITQKLYQDILEMRGHEVAGIASTGEEAIEMFRSFEKKPDLIIMDHRMAGMGGLDAARMILGIDPQTKIVFVSADDNAVWEALKLGMVGMRKPLNMGELLSAIEVVVPSEAIGNKVYGTGSKPTIARKGLYLVKETGGDRGLEMFKHLVSNGYEGIIFTRKHPSKLRSQNCLKEIPMIWFTSTRVKDQTIISPLNIQKMLVMMQSAFEKNERTVVYVWGFEYVITNLQFERALNLIQVISDRVMSSNEAVVLFSMDIDVLEERHRRMISKEFEIIE